LWEASAPLPPSTQRLQQQNVNADVVVIGAGFTGLSAALHLAEGGRDVVVLDGQEIGFGGSGRNVGLVNAGMWVMPEALPAALGEVYGSRLLQMLGNGPSVVFDLVKRHAMDCQATHKGTIHCAVGNRGWQELVERHRQWHALGAPVALLDKDQVAAHTGTDVYTGGLLDRRAGTIQPLAYARGLAHAASNAGAKIYTASPVTGARERNGGWLVETAQGAVQAKWVIVATNAYTAALWPVLAEELIRLPYFNLATTPLTAAQRAGILPGLEGVWDTRAVLSSFRLDQAGRLVFGSVGALKGPGLGIHRSWARRALAQIYPALRGIRFEHEWYGQIGMTSDNLPRCHRLGRNVLSFSGYNGRGIAPGTVFGQALAKVVIGETSIDDLPVPISDPSRARAKGAREAWFEIGAQLVHVTGARF
jgi:glycine/D-amino acid oxidase-like deaminating enzyme